MENLKRMEAEISLLVGQIKGIEPGYYDVEKGHTEKKEEYVKVSCAFEGYNVNDGEKALWSITRCKDGKEGAFDFNTMVVDENSRNKILYNFSKKYKSLDEIKYNHGEIIANINYCYDKVKKNLKKVDCLTHESVKAQDDIDRVIERKYGKEKEVKILWNSKVGKSEFVELKTTEKNNILLCRSSKDGVDVFKVKKEPSKSDVMEFLNQWDRKREKEKENKRVTGRERSNTRGKVKRV